MADAIFSRDRRITDLEGQLRQQQDDLRAITAGVVTFCEWVGKQTGNRVPMNLSEARLQLSALQVAAMDAPPSSGGATPIPADKGTNPKDLIGSDKLPIHLWPTTATAMGCLGLLNGMLKYGRTNWRASGVRASIYVDAAKRHLDAWFEGEEFDQDDGVPHLAAALACMAIIVDAQAAGNLNDDRAFKGGYRQLVTELTPHVARLKALHAERSPRHYTIADNKAATTTEGE